MKKIYLILYAMYFCTCSIFAQAPVILSFTPTTGVFFSNITITGSNLDNATAVSFGGTPAAYFYTVSPTIIQAFVGNGSSGDVMVTTVNGVAVKPGFIFPPPPVINSFTPSVGGLGTTVTILGSLFTGATGVYFGNVAAKSYNVLSDSIITATVGTGKSGYVSVYTGGGGIALTGFTHNGPEISTYSPTAGIAGSQVSITGIHFTNVNEVSIGGKPVASFTIVSPTKIIAIVAAGSSGDIIVSSASGSSVIKGFNLSVINSVTPDNGTIGSVITIRGFNFTGTNAVNFGDSAAKSFIVKDDTTIIATLANGASGPLSVKTVSYSSATYPYFYFFLPIPQILSIVPSVGRSGSIIRILGRYFTGTTSVRFGNTPVASFTVVSDSVITVKLGDGASGNVDIVNNYGSGSSSGFVYYSSPAIFSFSPPSGPVGTSINIKGINLDSSSNSNSIFFGAVKGTITSASDSSISVIVPAGASYLPFVLWCHNKALLSAKPFSVTFPGDTAFSPASFADKIDSGAGYLARDVVAGDFDGDGRPDLAVANYGDNSLSVYRNTGTNGNISFAPKLTFATSGGCKSITIADIDGDGKTDIAIANNSQLDIFKNTSTESNISFATPYSTSIGTGSQGIAFADFDKDGRLDFTVAGGNTFNGAVFMNTSVDGVISFSGFNMGGEAPLAVATGDMDGDGKTDIVFANGANASIIAGMVTVFKNNSAGPGSFTFSKKIYYTSVSLADIAIGDLDGDSKPDIALASYYSDKIFVLKNTTPPGGAISFDTPAGFASGPFPGSIRIADLNGDNKPDIVAGSVPRNNAYVFKNASSPGNVSFSPYLNYDGGDGLCLNDINGDGKPEIIFTNIFGGSVSILKNKVGPNLNILCPNVSGTVVKSNVTGNNYQWQVNAGISFSNIANDTNYTGTNSSALQLKVILSSFYGYKYRCIIDGNNYSDTIEIRFRNTWTGAVDNTWENPANWSCNAIPEINTDVIINAGNIVINTDVSIRSLYIQAGAAIQVNTGKHLAIRY